jgi:methylmalonyl-CoA mutase C-terminal domain/subunit
MTTPSSLDSPAARRFRILIAKPGLDGHDRGAKYVANILRDAGFEVIYTGIRRTPEQIVRAALQEDVDAIGISLLSGAHLTLVARLTKLLAEHGAGRLPIFVGGVIPESDIPELEALGVCGVYGPGTSARTLVDSLTARLSERQDERHS